MFAQMQRVFRFAPSPNGFLHLGHAKSALLNQQMAAQAGGVLLLRMENLDIGRCRPEFEAAIIEDLDWLGIQWQPPVRRQSEHLAFYRDGLDKLRSMRLLYPCFCSRQDVAKVVSTRKNWPCDPDGTPHYPGTCRGLSPGERRLQYRDAQPPTLRLDMAAALAHLPTPLFWHELGPWGISAQAADPAQWGDVILSRKDIPASYHLAVVLDDALQGITNIVRGQDLFAATSLHRLLQVLLEVEAPHYFHHNLICDITDRKLSKSTGAKSLMHYRQEGHTSAGVIEMAKRE